MLIKEVFQKTCKPPPPMCYCEISEFFRAAVLYSKEHPSTVTS